MVTPRPKLTVYAGAKNVWRIPLSRKLSGAEVSELLVRIGINDTVSYKDCVVTIDGSKTRSLDPVNECLRPTVIKLRDILWDMGLVTGENPEILVGSFDLPDMADAA